MNNPEFVYKVLQFFDSIDSHDSLYWDCHDNEVSFWINCNDLFWWATADLEEITEENFNILVETYKEFEGNDKAHDRIYHADALFACRSRKMRPQNCILKDLPEHIRPLFEACGPERTDKECG
jgi:hypothetical protein